MFSADRPSTVDVEAFSFSHRNNTNLGLSHGKQTCGYSLFALMSTHVVLSSTVTYSESLALYEARKTLFGRTSLASLDLNKKKQQASLQSWKVRAIRVFLCTCDCHCDPRIKDRNNAFCGYWLHLFWLFVFFSEEENARRIAKTGDFRRKWLCSLLELVGICQEKLAAEQLKKMKVSTW